VFDACDLFKAVLCASIDQCVLPCVMLVPNSPVQ